MPGPTDHEIARQPDLSSAAGGDEGQEAGRQGSDGDAGGVAGLDDEAFDRFIVRELRQAWKDSGRPLRVVIIDYDSRTGRETRHTRMIERHLDLEYLKLILKCAALRQRAAGLAEPGTAGGKRPRGNPHARLDRSLTALERELSRLRGKKA